VTDKSNSDSSLQVESAATGHVVTTVALPWKGAAWGAVAAVGNTGRFIVAAAPKNVPSRGFSYPTRLYTLTLSARGTVADLTPLGVPVLQGQVTSLAASADGRTVAYTLVPFDSRSDHWVGIITGRTTRQWSIGGLTRTGAGNLSIFDVSVSRDGGMVAFITQDQVAGDTAWVLPTGSAPGGITADARKVYLQEPILGPGKKLAWLDSALISADGSTLYLTTSGNSASGKVVTALTAYRTAGGAPPSTVTTFDGGFYRALGEVLTPAGGDMLLAWNNYVSTAYLINPATRTRTTLQLHGVPSLRFTAPLHPTEVILAW